MAVGMDSETWYTPAEIAAALAGQAIAPATLNGHTPGAFGLDVLATTTKAAAKTLLGISLLGSTITGGEATLTGALDAGGRTYTLQDADGTLAMLGSAQDWSAVQSFVGGIAVDTIAEQTADAGVTVDGVLIKDSEIAYNFLGNPTASKTFTVAAHDIQWNFTAAGGTWKYAWTGAASGHLFELLQETGNVATGTHLLHIEATDNDATCLHLVHNGAGLAMLSDGVAAMSNSVAWSGLTTGGSAGTLCYMSSSDIATFGSSAYDTHIFGAAAISIADNYGSLISSDGTTIDIAGGRAVTIGGNSLTIISDWTAAGQTCANLGTVTTVAINGGTITGASGSFTSLSASTSLTLAGSASVIGGATGAAFNVRHAFQNGVIRITGGTTNGTDTSINLFGSAHATAAGVISYNATSHSFYNPAGSTLYATLTASGLTVNGSGNALAMVANADAASYIYANGTSYDRNIGMRMKNATGDWQIYVPGGADVFDIFNVGSAAVIARFSTAGLNLLTAGDAYFISSTQVVGARRTGWTNQTATASRADLGASPTVGALASFCRAMYDDLKAHGLIGN